VYRITVVYQLVGSGITRWAAASSDPWLVLNTCHQGRPSLTGSAFKQTLYASSTALQWDVSYICSTTPGVGNELIVVTPALEQDIFNATQTQTAASVKGDTH